MSQSQYSGKFVLRANPRLHSDLARQARAQGLSLNEICLQKLSGFSLLPGKANQSDSPWSTLIAAARDHWKQKLKGILLFGSYARSEHGPTSDIDILFVLNSEEKIDRQLYRDFDVILSQNIKGTAFNLRTTASPRC